MSRCSVLDYLAALIIDSDVLWLTQLPSSFPSNLRDARRQHRRCLDKLGKRRGIDAARLPDVTAAEETLCIDELHLNVRTRSAMWQFERTRMERTRFPWHFELFDEVFDKLIPSRLGRDKDPEPRTVILLVRPKTDSRPTKDADALEQSLQAAVARAAPLARLQQMRVDAAKMSLSEQVRTFSRCLLLVGDHGAGLSNAVFMPTGSTVVELTHAACGRHCGDYFRPVSELSGVNHRRVAAANLTASDPHFGSLLDDSIATSLRATGIAAGSNGLLDTKQEF